MLGLIAGRGRLPLDVARAARRRGVSVAAVAFPGDTDPALAETVERIVWLRLGEIGRLLEFLREAGVKDAVLAGKILKTNLYGDLAALRPDARALALLAGLRDRSDDGILGAVADALAAEGILLRPQAELCPSFSLRVVCSAVRHRPCRSSPMRRSDSESPRRSGASTSARRSSFVSVR